MSMNRATLVAILSVGVMGGGTGSAEPVFYSTVTAGATFHGFPSVTVGENGLVYSTDSLGPATATLNGASAWASVVDTALHAFATTDASYTSATASAGFFDTLFLQSTTLPVGTPVQFAAELILTRQLTPDNVPVGEPCYLAAVAGGVLHASTGGQLDVQDATCDSVDINQPTGLVSGVIGQELWINAYLTVGVSALLEGFATADASRTLRFTLTPLGDFTYTTASGNTYAATQPPPLPEPATVLLLGVSVLAVASRRWLGRCSRRSVSARERSCAGAASGTEPAAPGADSGP